jgi:hypothetical protein
VGEECWKTDLEAVGARSLHLVEARILLVAVVATWNVSHLLEILPTISRVSGYSKNIVIGKIDSCLII